MPTKNQKVSYQMRWNKNSKVPKIQLTGDWLSSKGFEIGTTVQVKIQQGKITIQLEEK